MFKSIIAVVFAGLLAVSPASAAPEAVCVTPQDVLQYFINPPMPMPDMHPVAAKRGDEARRFLSAEGWRASMDRVELVFAFETKARTGQYLVIVFDADGCGVNSSGAKASKKIEEGFPALAPAGKWIPKARWEAGQAI